jgi:hypothetical protein
MVPYPFFHSLYPRWSAREPGKAMEEVVFVVSAGVLKEFCLVMQGGFRIVVDTGCSVKDLLCKQFGLSPEYVERRISTIFLDGKPLDDIESTVVIEGSRLSLSGAMPGLVGAVMRRKSFYAAFREPITYATRLGETHKGKGIIEMRLFNLLMEEMGVEFLKRGVLLTGSAASAFFAGRSVAFWRECRTMRVNESSVEPDELLRMLDASPSLLVRVVVVAVDAPAP